MKRFLRDFWFVFLSISFGVLIGFGARDSGNIDRWPCEEDEVMLVIGSGDFDESKWERYHCEARDDL